MPRGVAHLTHGRWSAGMESCARGGLGLRLPRAHPLQPGALRPGYGLPRPFPPRHAGLRGRRRLPRGHSPQRAALKRSHHFRQRTRRPEPPFDPRPCKGTCEGGLPAGGVVPQPPLVLAGDGAYASLAAVVSRMRASPPRWRPERTEQRRPRQSPLAALRSTSRPRRERARSGRPARRGHVYPP
jgi:hypothetical protein